MSCYAVDLDGVLCEIAINTPVKDHVPIIHNVTKVNQLYDQGHTVIIHTSRRENLRTSTELWLNKYGVKFQALVMNKLKADFYIDDRNIEIGQI